MNKIGVKVLIDLDKAECPCCSRPFEYEMFDNTIYEMFDNTIRYACLYCSTGCYVTITDTIAEARQRAKKDLIVTLLQRLGAIKVEFVSFDPIKLQPTDFGG